MQQCVNGHFYDETRFYECPYCGGTNGMNGVSGVDGQINKTVAGPSAGNANIGKTVAGPVSGASMDTGKTVAISRAHKNITVDPVCGFLICIEGPDKGKDFRIIGGRNFIGRGDDSDIKLSGDQTVSRSGHAVVTYDSKHMDFSVSAGQSHGLTYLNGERVDVTNSLNAYDKIEVGETVLMFLPFCGENFRWSDM